MNSPKIWSYREPSYTISGDVNEDSTENIWVFFNDNTTGVCEISPLFECIPEVSEVRASRKHYS